MNKTWFDLLFMVWLRFEWSLEWKGIARRPGREGDLHGPTFARLALVFRVWGEKKCPDFDPRAPSARYWEATGGARSFISRYIYRLTEKRVSWERGGGSWARDTVSAYSQRRGTRISHP